MHPIHSIASKLASVQGYMHTRQFGNRHKLYGVVLQKLAEVQF
ncbi:hypothetical protein [Paenibacillus turpanensis]|nr:hypothetical protein [Paenibacillus turpanensis]